MFEREGAGFKPPAAFPRKALVAWSTHDLPTLGGWWRGHDLDTRESLKPSINLRKHQWSLPLDQVTREQDDPDTL
jgi:4-alpha-glucanotransferase